MSRRSCPFPVWLGGGGRVVVTSSPPDSVVTTPVERPTPDRRGTVGGATPAIDPIL